MRNILVKITSEKICRHLSKLLMLFIVTTRFDFIFETCKNFHLKWWTFIAMALLCRYVIVEFRLLWSISWIWEIFHKNHIREIILTRFKLSIVVHHEYDDDSKHVKIILPMCFLQKTSHLKILITKALIQIQDMDHRSLNSKVKNIYGKVEIVFIFNLYDNYF